MTAPTAKPPERRMPESVKAFLLGDAYNSGGGSGRESSKHVETEERGESWMEIKVITLEDLQRCDEDGLTLGQVAQKFQVPKAKISELRRYYGLPVEPLFLSPRAPAATAGSSEPKKRRGRKKAEPASVPPPAPPPAEPPAAVLSTLPLAPFELHQRGRFNAVRLARRLAGIVALFECQEAEDEFELELCIRQAENEAEEEAKEAAAIIVTHELLSTGEIAAAAAVARTAGLGAGQVGPAEGDDAP